MSSKITLTFSDEKDLAAVLEFQAAMLSDSKKAVASLAVLRQKWEKVNAEATALKYRHDSLVAVANIYGAGLEKIEQRGRKAEKAETPAEVSEETTS